MALAGIALERHAQTMAAHGLELPPRPANRLPVPVAEAVRIDRPRARVVDELDAPQLPPDDLREPVHVVDRVRRVVVDQLLEHIRSERCIGAADHVDDAQRVLSALDRRLVRPVHEGPHRDERVPAARVIPHRVDPSGGRCDRLVRVHLRGELGDVARLENRVVVEDGDVVVQAREVERDIPGAKRIRLAAAQLAFEHGRAGCCSDLDG